MRERSDEISALEAKTNLRGKTICMAIINIEEKGSILPVFFNKRRLVSARKLMTRGKLNAIFLLSFITKK